ncbi:MAG: hypothetical protein ACO3PV_00965 [Pseudohongiellaceae bacterium]
MNKTFLAVCIAALALLGQGSAQAQAPACDERCLTDIAQQYLQDVVTQDWSKLPWADRVRYTENNVAMMIGDGFWGAGPTIVGEGLYLADASTGNVEWWGITAEPGQAAYHGLRLQIENREITEVESYLGREGTPDLFAAVADYRLDAAFSTALGDDARTPRDRMVALVDGWFNSRQLNDGKVFTSIADDCVRTVNGLDTTQDEYWAAQLARGCRQQLELGLYKPVDRIRARRYPVVDEETGVVVALSLEDHAVRYLDYSSTDGSGLKVEVPYPSTRGRLELFKIKDGAITRIDGVSVFLPYYIHSLWDSRAGG